MNVKNTTDLCIIHDAHIERIPKKSVSQARKTEFSNEITSVP